MPLNVNDKPWRMEVPASAGGNSVPVLVPNYLADVTITALPGVGGTATAYITTDEPDDVEADPNNANWIEWGPGSVNANTASSPSGPVTGVRLAAVTEDAVLQVCGRKSR